jgi:hypothetical protein
MKLRAAQPAAAVTAKRTPRADAEGEARGDMKLRAAQPAAAVTETNSYFVGAPRPLRD